MQRVVAVFAAAWAGWKKIAHIIGTFNARVLLTVFYFLLVMPVALLMRMAADPLRLAKQSETHWVPVQRDVAPDLEYARRQGG